MGRRRKGHGCAVTVLVLMLLLMAAGGAGGYIYMRKYMPSDELSDKAKVFGIKGSQVALLLDNELQEEKGIYEDGQVYLPVGWVNEYLNQRFYWDEGEKLLVYALPESIVYADEDAQGECTCPWAWWSITRTYGPGPLPQARLSACSLTPYGSLTIPLK